ncbi:MAG: MATE family efflux transporter [Oscillospiraceae bacterium]|nr:MATE family efflux transporter [Oscillospiraceae bacterium]
MAETARDANPLGYERIGKLLRGFAIPSIIALLVSSLYNVVDQVFIGQGVGFLGNAATNVSFPLTTICMAITLAIGIGSSAQFSLNLGRGDEEEAGRVVGNGVCMMIAFGVAYAALAELLLSRLLWAFGATPDVYDYALTYSRITVLGMPFLMGMNGMSALARADGSPTYSMLTMIIGAVINLVLDPIFIFVFHWGVAGAAWATVIGQVVAWGAAMRYLRRFKRVTLHRDYFRLSPQRVGRTFTMGMSNGLTQLAITLVQVVMNRSMAHYGGLSIYGPDIPLAASGVVMKVNSLVFSIVIGFNQGMQPIVGFNYGARRYGRVRDTYFLVIKCVLAVTLTGLTIFELFPGQVLSIFGKENELYMSFARLFMRVFLMMLPLNGVQVISSNLFAAIGKPVRGALLALTRQVFFLIPLMLLLPLAFGVHGVIAAAPAADVLGFLVVLIFITREMRAMMRLPQAEG